MQETCLEEIGLNVNYERRNQKVVLYLVKNRTHNMWNTEKDYGVLEQFCFISSQW